MIITKDLRTSGSHGSQSQVMRETIIVRLLSFVKEMARIEHGVVALHHDVEAIVGKNSRGKLGASVSLAFIARVGCEDGNGRGTAYVNSQMRMLQDLF